jgi:hypothetical protein|tara:strand:- start:195 stop:563 length:369 start_codon:yes stop_codon:yes gene_type:complete
MPKVTGFNRKRIGHRNYLALIENAPTEQDEYGQVTYSTGSWTTAVSAWPCELIDTTGGEIIDGMMTKTSTEKVAIGDKPQIDAADVTAKSRCIIDGKTYGITAVRDVSGDGFTVRLELRSTK